MKLGGKKLLALVSSDLVTSAICAFGSCYVN